MHFPDFFAIIIKHSEVERRQLNKGAFPSGQWGQTVNLLLNASVVRIHQLPPQKPRRINVLRVFLFLDHVLDPTPSGYRFQNTFMDDYLKEWEVRKRELLGKTISPEESTVWKLQWPCSCDSCGKCEAQNQWRVLQSLQRDTKEWASQRSHLLCTLNTR